ncbi:MAG TPA: AAA family ATPase, partial [Thermoanaerobaculia bacterium]|nr:AAA family ATPase [Thermoanaerobaculia bacterium]
SDSSIDEDLIVGTPGYMSPEQIAMARPAPAGDWYSFGVMLYQALTGRRLFSGANAGEILDQQLRATPIPARDVLPGLPEELCALADRCLERDPSQRPEASEILETLGSSLVQARGNVRSHERPAELIGRGREVRTLVRHVTALTEEGSGMVLLHGAPGVGKSVLADRVLDEVRATTGALILGGRCHGWESLPFNAIDAIVDSVARHVRTHPSPAIDEMMSRCVAMTGLFPTLAFPTSAASSEDETILMPPTPSQVLARASHELHALLAAMADGRRVVLFLDDSQWGDYQSAEVFLRLLNPSHSLPLVLVLCYSTDDWRTSLLLQALIGSPIRRHEVRVESLSSSLTEKLAKRDLPEASKSMRTLAARQSDGNPGLLGHIVRHVVNDASAEPLLAHAVAARLSGLSTSAQRIFSLLQDESGPMAEDEVERRLELFESDEPLRTLTRARLVRLRRTGDLFELDLYHPRLRGGLGISNSSN